MYDYVITKPPLNEDTLAHYGVKGMKWRKKLRKKLVDVRRDSQIGIISDLSDKIIKNMDRKRKEKYVANHLAEDIYNKKRKETNLPYATKTSKGFRTREEMTDVMRYRPDGKHVKAIISQNYKNKNDSFGKQVSTSEKEFNKALKSQKKRKEATTKK